MHESELVVPEIADITISNHCIHGDGLVGSKASKCG